MSKGLTQLSDVQSMRDLKLRDERRDSKDSVSPPSHHPMIPSALQAQMLADSDNIPCQMPHPVHTLCAFGVDSTHTMRFQHVA